MNELGPWIAASSFILSAAVLLFSAMNFRRMARKDFVDELSGRLDRCEASHAACERARATCETERVRLERLTTTLILENRTMTDAKLREERPPDPGPPG